VRPSIFLGLLFIFSIFNQQAKMEQYCLTASWTVVGAGPAGIAVIGLLLDCGIDGRTIVWIDPEFNVGRLGKYYYHVPGNAKAKDYTNFIGHCRVFNEINTSSMKLLRMCNPAVECTLHFIIDPLRDITKHLCTKVTILQKKLTSLTYKKNVWKITAGNNNTIHSRNVVLAIGSHPQSLNYPCKQTIPLDIALDKATLSRLVNRGDSIALIGSSHSAILVLKNLHEIGVKKIINFFKHPITYAYDMGEGNQTYFNGLKGTVAQWAYRVLEKKVPRNILRIANTSASRNKWLSTCNKTIYAVGYERNPVPLITNDNKPITYNSKNGIITKHLFGIGIAFPEEIIDSTGAVQPAIGIVDFMEYAKRIVSLWIDKHSYNEIGQPMHYFMVSSRSFVET